MTSIPPLKKTENYQRFTKVRISLLAIGLLVFLTSLAFHSSTVNPFSLRASFIERSVIGFILGNFVFILGSLIAARYFIPSVYVARYLVLQKSSSDEPPLAIHRQELESYQYDDRYNNITNPASPLYQAIHTLHRD